uniref:Putative LOC100212901 [Hydra vulgaris] n=1 Tax=Lepeophtheirus salmonis TaxID=72036 RepID=A0A0K2V098_LEPSM
MGKACVVPGCRSGYKPLKSENNTNVIAFNKKIGYHMFPKDEALRKKWIQAIPRKNWEPTKYSAICALHFDSSDLRTEPQDSNKFRRNKPNLIRKVLKKDAIPTKFPSVPFHNPRRRTVVRSENDLSPCRLSIDHEKSINTLDTVDAVLTLDELNSKLDRGLYPEKIFDKFNKVKKELLFHSICDTDSHGFTILFSLKVNSDMSIQIWLKNEEFPFYRLKHIIRNNCIEKCSVLLNILAYMNSLTNSDYVYNDTKDKKRDIKDELNECFSRLDFLLPEIEDIIKVEKLEESSF